MQIQKTDLLKIIDAILPGADKAKSLLEGADTIVLTPHTAYTYNGSVSVSHPLPEGVEGFEWAFKADNFNRLLRATNGDVVDFTIEGDSCTVSCGDAEATFPRMTVAILANIAKLEESEPVYLPVPEDFSAAIALCAMKGTRADINRGVLVESGHVVSTDGGQRINHYAFESAEWGHLPFRLDEPHALTMAKVPNITELSVDMGWLHFKTSNGATYHVKRTDHTGYPMRPERFLPMLNKIVGDVPAFQGKVPEELQKAVNLAAILGASLKSDNGELTTLTLEIKRDHMVVKGESGIGRVNKKVKLNTPLEKDPGLEPITVYAQFLQEAGRKAMDFSLHLQAGEKPPVMVFRSDRYTHLAVCGARKK